MLACRAPLPQCGMKPFSKRFVRVCVLGVAVGCSAENTAPPPITSQHREMVKQSLAKLGAKVTADTPETLYLSLRNNHFEIRELGATIESAPRTQRDIQDFALAIQAVGGCFLEPGEADEFRNWLRTALAPQAPPVLQAEYHKLKVTLSRKPLRAIFTRKQPAEAE